MTKLLGGLTLLVLLSGCVSSMGYVADSTVPVTLKFRTTSDHFGLVVDGMFIRGSELDAPVFVQPQWVNLDKLPFSIEGAQGVDAAQRGKAMEFTWNLTLLKKDDVDTLSFAYRKGFIGLSTLEVTYPDETGKIVTHLFNANPGPSAAIGVWKLALKEQKS